MSAHIRYAYLKGHTWLFRRNYPVDVALALGAQRSHEWLLWRVKRARDRRLRREIGQPSQVGICERNAQTLACGIQKMRELDRHLFS